MERLPHSGATPDETPAIVSDAFAFEFARGVPADDVVAWLQSFATRAAAEARERGGFVGHIKLYAEAEPGFACWVASTGGAASVQARGAEGTLRGCRVAVTAIVFCTTVEVLRAGIGRLLHEAAPGQNP